MSWGLQYIGTQMECGEVDAASANGIAMQDVTMLLFTVVFFSLAFLYVKACQKLR